MDKCMLAKLLREEIYNLTRIAEALEDKSKLCYPNMYDCSQCLDEVVRNLKRVKRLSKDIYYPPAFNSGLNRRIFGCQF